MTPLIRIEFVKMKKEAELDCRGDFFIPSSSCWYDSFANHTPLVCKAMYSCTVAVNSVSCNSSLFVKHFSIKKYFKALQKMLVLMLQFRKNFVIGQG